MKIEPLYKTGQHCIGKNSTSYDRGEVQDIKEITPGEYLYYIGTGCYKEKEVQGDWETEIRELLKRESFIYFDRPWHLWYKERLCSAHLVFNGTFITFVHINGIPPVNIHHLPKNNIKSLYDWIIKYKKKP